MTRRVRAVLAIGAVTAYGRWVDIDETHPDRQSAARESTRLLLERGWRSATLQRIEEQEAEQ